MTAAPYPPTPADVAFLQSQPFDHHWRNISTSAFLNRIQTERSLYEAHQTDPVFSLVVVVRCTGRSPEGLARTLRSVALQSCPGVECVVFPDGGKWVRETVSILRGRGLLSEKFVVLDEMPATTEASFVCFACPGDVFHPSLGHAIALSAGSADVVVWNDIEVPTGGRPRTFRFYSRPALERHTLRQYDYIGRSFAVRVRRLGGYEEDWLMEAGEGNLRFLQLWLAECQEIRWAAAHEYLTVRYLSSGSSFGSNYQTDHLRYRAHQRRYWERFDLSDTGKSEQPYVLTPRRKPQSLSVVIPFRDQPELTLRSARSVFDQQAPFDVNVTLVDNQSSSDSIDVITEALDRDGYGSRYQLLAYDAPFNHSAECNLGARHSHAEVVLFLNNDACLMDDKAIAEIGAWALDPDVATVGVRMEDRDGNLQCAGLQLRRSLPEWYNSPMEESQDPFLSGCIRETAGNTFAAAAVEVRKLSDLGWLDEKCFPNGFNDVEFCLRARKSGYTHIYLGNLRAMHLKSETRRRSDEMPQKVRLRDTYPDTMKWALGQLGLNTRVESLAPGDRFGAALGRLARRLKLR